MVIPNRYTFYLTHFGLFWMVMLLPARLGDQWARNNTSVTILSNITPDAISPYACQLIKNCNQSFLHFQKVDDQIQLITRSKSGITRKLFIPEARSDMFDLLFGILLLDLQSEEQAVVQWQNSPSIADYLIDVSNSFETELDNRRQLLQLSLSVQPSFEGYYNLGNILLVERQIEKALAAYQDALSLAQSSLGEVTKTDLIRLYNQRGRAYFRQGNYEVAQVSYEKALELGNWGASYIGLGRSLLKQDRVSEAIIVFEKGVAIYPDSPRLPYQLAQAYVQQGNLEQAHEIVTKLIELDRQFADAWQLLAQIERINGNIVASDEAQSMYELLLKKGSSVED